jgi:excisionase family DNA binding protein
MPGDAPLPPVWLTVREAAARARVGPKVIYAAARGGRLRAARVDGRRSLRFRTEWIDEFLESTAEPREVSRRWAR